LAKNQNKLLSAIPAIQPVRNENLKRMASGFGYRTDPFTARKMHEGMDFTAKVGTPILQLATELWHKKQAATLLVMGIILSLGMVMDTKLVWAFGKYN
jgi:hypothetical protein